MEPLPPINKVYSLIIQEERQHSIHLLPASSNSSNYDALVVFAARGKSSKKERPLCTHCGIHGHTVDKCFKLHGYPPGYKPRSKASSSSANQVVTEVPPRMDIGKFQQALAMLAAHMARASPPKVEAPEQPVEQGIVLSTYNLVSLNKYQWIVDSRASCHICIDLSQFSSITPVFNVFFTLPNSSQVLVQFVGNVVLSKHLILHDVYFVPGFRFNLISVGALLKHSHLSITFNSQFLLIQDSNHLKMIGRAELLKGLYVFKADSSSLPSSDIGASIHSSVLPSGCHSRLQSVASCNSHSKNNIPLTIWHARLGHSSD